MRFRHFLSFSVNFGVSHALVTLELHNTQRLEKEVLDRAVAIAQKSTASMGKFDKLNPGEKKVKRKPEVSLTD